MSLYPGVELADFTLPASVLAAFAGPRFGVDGLRRLTGVHGRPLLATALKPRGLPVSEYARMAGAFAAGGGDLVKDDQNLVTDFDGFRDRVFRCRDAVGNANARTEATAFTSRSYRPPRIDRPPLRLRVRGRLPTKSLAMVT